ncbi:uncharacterized protein ACDP82_000914 [Pangshura tecta]
MLGRGHERDALQCRVKVKELRSAYYKAREVNRRSGAAPTTCRFYGEMDEILGGDPTANLRTTLDTSDQGGGQEQQQEEEEEEKASEATGMGEDTPESQEACSQDLFSSQEEGSQSQQPAVAEGQSEEHVTVTLTAGLPSSSTAQRLQNLRKKPRKNKEDMLKAVIDHSARESRTLQDWRERESRIRQRESRIRQRNAVAKRKSTEQLLSILSRQADFLESPVAMQAEHYRATPPPPPIPKLFPLCPNVSSNPPSPASRFLPPPAASNTCTFTNQP